MTGPPDILVLESRISLDELRRLARDTFVDMVKYVVDVERRTIAIGGQLHADLEQVLLDLGSRQEDVWGANYYPGRGRESSIEFTSLINIRPAHGNSSMEVQDPELQNRIRTLTHEFIGTGEES